MFGVLESHFMFYLKLLFLSIGIVIKREKIILDNSIGMLQDILQETLLIYMKGYFAKALKG